MSLRTAYRVDAPALCIPVTDAAGRKVGDAEIALRTNPNTGALEFVAPLTWTGVRRYRHADGSFTRELRRPEQVRSESHKRGLQLLTATANHPALPDGTPVYLDARGGPGVMSPDGSALRPARDFEVGHVGDSIVDSEIDGYYVPLGRIATTDLATQLKIAAGRTQTSLGYTCLLDDTGGTWEGPHGPEAFDVEHVLDHEDPRVKDAVAAGVLATVERLVDGKIVQVPVIGPNHFAIAIWAGRGELQSEIVDFSAPVLDAGSAAKADARTATPGFCAVVADSAPPQNDPAVQRAAKTARLDRLCAQRLTSDILNYLSNAELSGHYAEAGCEACSGTGCPACAWEWLGWIVPACDSPAAGGIAFIATDGLGLWWSNRGPDGGVIGDPIAFAWRGPQKIEVETEIEVEASGGTVEVEAETEIELSAGNEVRSTAVPTEATPNPGERPRLFAMIRQADESGVSGTGHVLDGVVWRNGKTSAAWDTPEAPGSVVVFDSYADFLAVHVDQHPSNNTILTFDDGAPAPAAPAESRVNGAVIVVDAIAEHSARQASPDKYNAFMRFALPNGASFILGRAGASKPWEVQSVRFPAADWNVASAKKWLKAIGLSASSFEKATQEDSLDNDIEENDVSFVAQEKSATYAHDVRGDAAGARFPTMKILIPTRCADAAGALATAVKAPVPAKVADAAMLEVELPEGTDPLALAAGVHALAAALEKMSGAAAGMEAKAEEMGADYAAAIEQLDAAKKLADSLAPDAEFGRAARLAEVVALAKKAGLTDADVAGKDADAVRTAACAKKYPNVKHLDAKPVLDGMWTALLVAISDAKPEPKPDLKPEPKPRVDSAGEVADPPRKIRSAHLTMHDYG